VTSPPNEVSASELVTRLSWRFAEDGRSVACTVVRPSGPPELEISQLAPTGPTSRTPVAVPSLGPHSQLLPISQGRILVCHHRDGGQQVDLVTLGRGARSVRRLMTTELAGFRLIALPARRSAGRGLPILGPACTLALAVSHAEDGRSAIWELTEDGAIRPAALTPGIFTGGIWLDGGGRRLGGEVAVDGRPCDGVAVDLATGSCETVLSLSKSSNDRFIAYSANGRVLVVSTDLTGEVRLGVGRPDDGPIGFPPALHRNGHEVRLIALDHQGRLLLLAHELGASSRLSVYHWGSGHTMPVNAPPGVVVGPGVFNRSWAHFVYSTPSRPAGIATMRHRTPGWSLADDPTGEDGKVRPICARSLVFSGATGPVETISYGQPYQSDKVVIALHGGPLSAWRLGFDPLLHTLAANGFGILAPNQRGSTHYGVAHALAIRGRWGGPDLEDILAIARSLRSDRAGSAARPIVLGTSYGAFLALLAAAADPTLWGGCIAFAPFLSGPRLYPEAGDATRTLIERLGGLTVPVVDGKGRDVFERCGEIVAPVLLVHGTEDDVVPIGQSRLLYQRLMAEGRSGAEFVEIPGAGHDPTVGRHQTLVFDRVLRFCQQARAESSTRSQPALRESRKEVNRL
jgi:pimeloyl-ACP methyl ester carboxylesterase